MRKFSKIFILVLFAFAPLKAAIANVQAMCVEAPEGSSVPVEQVPIRVSGEPGIVLLTTEPPTITHQNSGYRFYVEYIDRIPTPSSTEPVDRSSYTIDFGDGEKEKMTFSAYYPTKNELKNKICFGANWSATHIYSKAGTYTAIMYKDGKEIGRWPVFSFTAQMEAMTLDGQGPYHGSDLSKDTPGNIFPAFDTIDHAIVPETLFLTLTGTFPKGSIVDYGDGTSETLPSENGDTSLPVATYKLKHTFTSLGKHYVLVKYGNTVMTELGVVLHAGGMLSPNQGPAGTVVTMSGGDFKDLSTIVLYRRGIAVLDIKNFVVSKDGKSVKFQIPQRTYESRQWIPTTEGPYRIQNGYTNYDKPADGDIKPVYSDFTVTK